MCSDDQRHIRLHFNIENTMKELVGTELSKLIPEWAVKAKAGCRCKDFAAKMDRWGVEGCEKRRDVIVVHLLGQADHLIPVLKAVPESMKRIGASRLLSAAIANAKK